MLANVTGRDLTRFGSSTLVNERFAHIGVATKGEIPMEIDYKKGMQLTDEILLLLKRRKVDPPWLIGGALAEALNIVITRDCTNGDQVAAALYNAECFREIAEELAQSAPRC
jgi:hypothetical protein